MLIRLLGLAFGALLLTCSPGCTVSSDPPHRFRAYAVSGSSIDQAWWEAVSGAAIDEWNIALDARGCRPASGVWLAVDPTGETPLLLVPDEKWPADLADAIGFWHEPYGDASGWLRVRVLAAGSGEELAEALRVTLLHELGHSLGLKHSPVRGELMWVTANPGIITEGDIDKAVALICP